MISMLDPDCIQEPILANFATALNIKGYPKSPVAFNRARAELIAASLIKRHKDREEISVHRLVQDSARAKMTNEEISHVFWHTVLLIRAQWPIGMAPATMKGAPPVPVRFHRIDRWTKCEELYPHVLRLKRQFSILSTPKEAEDLPKLQLAELLNDAAW